MEKKKLPPLCVDVANVKPLIFGAEYESRMILDHAITGRDDDEIYYILSGKGKLQLDDKIIDVYGGQVIFIPAGCFHALDNRGSDEDLCILTFWKDWRFNDAYETRLKLWGKSFKTIDED